VLKDQAPDFRLLTGRMVFIFTTCPAILSSTKELWKWIA
jgi:hypothetical protein